MVALATACGGTSPASPSQTSGGPAATELRVTGLPDALSPGGSAQLKAAVFQNGTGTECSAAWSVDNTKVATISSSGVLMAVMTGYVNVTASCAGLTTRIETKVETTNPYRLVIVAYDGEVPGESGVTASMTFLDGPLAGQSITTGSVFTNGVPDLPWPAKVRFTADSYEPKEFVLAEATGTRRNPTSSLFDFRVPLTFAPDALTDTYVRQMSRAEMEIAHPFALRVPGPVQIRTWWSVDYNDLLFVELWCSGQLTHPLTTASPSDTPADPLPDSDERHETRDTQPREEIAGSGVQRALRRRRARGVMRLAAWHNGASSRRVHPMTARANSLTAPGAG